jgi:hypothetical protein
MKKIWYVKGRYGSGKWFKTEKAFLSHVREDDTREVFVYQLIDSGIAGDLKKRTITERDRDNQLKNILGEANKYEEAIANFRAKFEEIAPEETQGKRYVLSNLKIIGLDKKEFSNMATGVKNYLLFEVSDTVEWYQTLLRCHNFVSIPTNYYGRGTGRIETEQTKIDNFKAAKESLKKKPTRKKKETV